jgi:hypothetical protein
MSSRITGAPSFAPKARQTLVAPMFPLPNSLMSRRLKTRTIQ